MANNSEDSEPIKALLKSREFESPFGLGAQIDYNFFQDDTFDRQHLDVDVYFDETQIFYDDAKSEGFTLRFNRCDLVVEMDGGDIQKPPSQYCRTLPVEDFQLVVQTTKESSNQKALGFGIKTNKFIRHILGPIGFRIDARGKLSFKGRNNFRSQEDASKPYVIIQPIARNRWRIGHEEHGDPTSPDGTLDGQYFRRDPDDVATRGVPIDKRTSLGVMVPLPRRKNVTIVFELRARFQDCVFEPFGENFISDGPKTAKAKIEKHFVLKAIQSQQSGAGEAVRENEFIVARCTINVREDT